MNLNEIQNLTEQTIYGRWYYKDDQYDLKLIISKHPSYIRLDFNGEIIEFTDNAHWFGDYHLCFTGPYYVRISSIKNYNENQLIFGKLSSEAIIGDYEWEFVFNRT